MTSPLEALCAALVVLALTAYVVLGGADFGGGVWDALARGPNGKAQREVIARAMGPVWETNHVWLIFAIVATWTAFPAGFAAMFTLLAVPILIALAGIVLRGGAFALRERAAELGQNHGGLSALFGATSIVTPLFLGASIGALASGHAGEPTGATDAWLQPFPVCIGVFALCMCALLAATFLTVETDGDLRELFRERAITAWFATAIVGFITLAVARTSAMTIFSALAQGRALIPFAAALLTGFVTLAMLIRRRFPAARASVVLQVTLVLLAWAVAQYPYVVVPTLTIAQAAAPKATLQALAIVACIGLAILIPSLLYLFSVFKNQSTKAS